MIRRLALSCAVLVAPLAAQDTTHLASAERTVWLRARESTVATLQTRVALDLHEAPLSAALDAVAQQTSLQIGYGRDVTASKARVSLHVERMTVGEALGEILTGTHLTAYVSIDGRQLLVRAPFPDAHAPATAEAQHVVQGVSISGTVREKFSTGVGHGIEGVTVIVVGTRQGAITDARGAFIIRGVAPGRVKLTAQFVGYEPSTQTVDIGLNGATVSFELTRVVASLSGVVVTATGEESRRSVGTAMATIDTAQIDHSAATTTQQLLAGSTPGVTVLANSGQPGGGGTIVLRGINSITQSNLPLIYVDGVRVYNGESPTNPGSRQYVSPLNDIPAEDIDHIEVIKGPAATTLYGTEASGGVLQVFTKHGSEGAPQWQAGVTGGFNNMGHVGPASDPTGMGFNDCKGVREMGDGTKFEDLSCPANGSWLHDGPISRFNLSVRGGTAGGITYFVSGNADNAEGVLPEGGDYSRRLQATVAFKPARGLTVGVSQSITGNRQVGFPDGNNGSGAMLNISRGSGADYQDPVCPLTGIDCVVDDSAFTTSEITTVRHYTTGLTLDYTAIANLSNRFAFGYDYNNSDLTFITPYGNIRIPGGRMIQTLWDQQYISADFASTYRWQIAKALSTSTSVGGQLFDNQDYEVDLETQQFSGPGAPTLLSGALQQFNGAIQQRDVNAGLFAQEVIGWREKLFVTAGARFDGNSAFGQNFGVQTYPKISGSYVISDEAFWPFPWFESLKLRAAVGDAGRAPGAFDAVRTWTPVAALGGQPAFEPNQVGDANLAPERTREVEAGFDASAFHGGLTVQYTYYSRTTSRALIPVQQPPSLGFATTQLVNAGTVMNSGNELMVAAELLRFRNADVQARLGFTTIHSVAGNIGGQTLTINPDDATYLLQGLPVPAYYGTKVLNANAHADPIIAPNQFLGSVYPTHIWSPGGTIRLLRRFTIDVLGEWQLGGHNMNADGYQNAGMLSWQPCFAAQAAMRQAAAGNPAALAPYTALDRAKCTLDQNFRLPDFWVEPNDFFKLRSVSLSYDIPRRFLPFARSGAIIFKGLNLFTSTKYDGTDPEVADQRDDMFARRDYYVFPQPRTFTFTLNLGL
jgi:TonB-linked SusC/RagA family outer membrane protein